MGPRLLQGSEVESSLNEACFGIDDENFVMEPAIGKDLSFDKFQFIDSVDRPELIVDFHRAHQGEILGLEEAKESRAVAENEIGRPSKKTASAQSLLNNSRSWRGCFREQAVLNLREMRDNTECLRKGGLFLVPIPAQPV